MNRIIDASCAADLSTAINTAVSALGSTLGVISVETGGVLPTPVVIGPGQTLSLGPYTYDCQAPLGQIQFNLSDGAALRGAGYSTVLLEPPGFVTAGPVRQGDARSFGVEISDLRILGRGQSGTSSQSGISLGNAMQARIERVTWDHTDVAYALSIGGSSHVNGYHARNVWVRDCLFLGLTGEGIAIVNADNWHVEGCTFDMQGLPIDVEPNEETDSVARWTISNCIGLAAVIQDPSAQRGTITGCVCSALSLNGAQNIAAVGNVFGPLAQAAHAVALVGAQRVVVGASVFVDVGSPGFAAVISQALPVGDGQIEARDCLVVGNLFAVTPGTVGGTMIEELPGASGNAATANKCGSMSYAGSDTVEAKSPQLNAASLAWSNEIGGEVK